MEGPGPGGEGLLSRPSRKWQVASWAPLLSGRRGRPAGPPSGPGSPSRPLVGTPAGYGQLFVGGQGVAGQEELGVDGATAGLGYLGPTPAGGPAARGAPLVQGEKLVKHVRDEHQPLVQLCHLWGQEQRRVRRRGSPDVQAAAGARGSLNASRARASVGPARVWNMRACLWVSRPLSVSAPVETCGRGGALCSQGAVAQPEEESGERPQHRWPTAALGATLRVLCPPCLGDVGHRTLETVGEGKEAASPSPVWGAASTQGRYGGQCDRAAKPWRELHRGSPAAAGTAQAGLAQPLVRLDTRTWCRGV